MRLWFQVKFKSCLNLRKSKLLFQLLPTGWQKRAGLRAGMRRWSQVFRIPVSQNPPRLADWQRDVLLLDVGAPHQQLRQKGPFYFHPLPQIWAGTEQPFLLLAWSECSVVAIATGPKLRQCVAMERDKAHFIWSAELIEPVNIGLFCVFITTAFLCIFLLCAGLQSSIFWRDCRKCSK